MTRLRAGFAATKKPPTLTLVRVVAPRRPPAPPEHWLRAASAVTTPAPMIALRTLALLRTVPFPLSEACALTWRTPARSTLQRPVGTQAEATVRVAGPPPPWGRVRIGSGPEVVVPLRNSVCSP